MFLIFDTETTGRPINYNAPLTDFDNWPRVVQLAWQLHSDDGILLKNHSFVIKPDAFDIPFKAAQVHGISTELAEEIGVPIHEAIGFFLEDLKQSKYVVGHNISFDTNILGSELLRYGYENLLTEKTEIDTIASGTTYCKLPGGKGGGFKYPSLTELHDALFHKPFSAAHNAIADVEATAKCFFKLIAVGELKNDDAKIANDIDQRLEETATVVLKDIVDFFDLSNSLKQRRSSKNIQTEDLTGVAFSHLHCHSQFSVLQSTIKIKELVKSAVANNMPSLALTDFGNMYGIFNFVKEAWGHTTKNEEGKDVPVVKPIIGCELYMCKDMHDKTHMDEGITQVLLAKNINGYKNLSKLSSDAFTEGKYYVPRIDKQFLSKHKQDLIALSGGLTGEIPYLLLNVGKRQAEEALQWYLKEFGEDFYLEICRHGLPEEQIVNDVLMEFSEKYNIKYVAANDVRYLQKNDMEALDIMMCIKDNQLVTTEIGKGRGYRKGFNNSEFYFKTQEEMKFIFADLPDAIKNIDEIDRKIEAFKLERDILLPIFHIPPQFEIHGNEVLNQGEYLRHLTYEGATKRYNEITEEIRNRIDFELETIIKQGYPGYFLIVEDFIRKAREMGVSVGPGRGSAAGSVIAYCTGITNIDPIKYDLLFERFLNPERISMPDIDIDFDDRGRQKVIDYVVEKYGADQVAQIITYGTMAAKSSVKNTARVMNIPLQESERLAKFFTTFSVNDIYNFENGQAFSKALRDKGKDGLKSEDIKNFDDIKAISLEQNENARVLQMAQKLEGSLRNTGIHACGIIITPDDMRNYIPVAEAKDSKLFATQFDNNAMESAGLLKMDFLGLNTLTIINDALDIIKKTKNIDIDIDKIPLDDLKTFQLFQKGDTVGIFQFESPGMQKYLRELIPDKFEDLIAMNALYRPGPIAYIPDFINRKLGKEKITYDLDVMEEFLKDTYGITVYQEQVMLQSQKIAGFSKGQADTLRKAMGKKQKATLDKMKSEFIAGGTGNGHAEEKLNKIWTDWEAFASYAFNKSHSTCYAYVAYQTAYLKANYPVEFMAAVLISNKDDISQIKIFIEECKRMKIDVLGPDVNESEMNFGVNSKGQIRFGFAAIKGVGEAAADEIVNERNTGGIYVSEYDFVARINIKNINKRVMESLAYSGGFDSFGTYHRAQYFAPLENEKSSPLEQLIKYGTAIQNQSESNQSSLFGDNIQTQITQPKFPEVEPWPRIISLNYEKDVLGMYITGHPLDVHEEVIKIFGNTDCSKLAEMDLSKSLGIDFYLPCIVTSVITKVAQNGNPWGSYVVSDDSGSFNFNLFNKDYVNFNTSLIRDSAVMIKLKVTDYIKKNSFANAEGEPERNYSFKIDKIELLSEIPKKMCQTLTIKLTTEQLASKETVDSIKKISNNEGVYLEVQMVDERAEMKSLLKSQTKMLPDNFTLKQFNELSIPFHVRVKPI